MDKRLNPVYKNKMDFVESNVFGAKTVLDVGCGEGHYFHLYKGTRYKGIDQIRVDNKKVVCASAEKMPFKNESFDTVVCMDVIEHVEDYDKALSEIHRVLKPGGRLIISVPNLKFPITYDPINAFLRLFNKKLPIGMWAWGHKRLYTTQGIKADLAYHDFRITKHKGVSHGFITLFVNYIPYIINLFKKKGFKNKKGTTKTLTYRVYQWLNNIDKKYFGWTNPAFLCFVAVKK